MFGKGLAGHSVLFFLSYSAAAARYKRRNLIPPQQIPFWENSSSFFEKFLYICVICAYMLNLLIVTEPFQFFFLKNLRNILSHK